MALSVKALSDAMTASIHDKMSSLYPLPPVGAAELARYHGAIAAALAESTFAFLLEHFDELRDILLNKHGGKK